MVKRIRHLSKRPKSTKALHQAPGTVTYVGSKEQVETTLEVIDYNADNFERFTSKTPEDAFKFEAEDRTTWINIDGLSNTAEIEKVGKYYELHPLIIEDIVNTNQRPKIDEYGDYFFIVAKMLYYRKDGRLENEHISIVLGKNYVLTFQEAGGDVFDGVRERLSNAKGRIRSRGADYLVFALLDAIVDNYFVVVEEMSDKIESLEERLFNAQPNDDITLEIQELKRTMLRIRRAVNPLREVVSRLEKVDHELVQEQTINYIRDLYDHMIQVSENIEIYREMTWGLMDMYMTTISNKMNEVMKVLTIMASIFIPLTFLAGLYGMNFEYMPELEYRFSYPILLGVMFLMLLGMLFYFKRKHWL
ncbi:MAG: magnesium/cobalt transporter CorA [Salinimicrobium sediminis]|uniref:Magnesium transport protein CorA n=1 Tax=Salinimicrobium sediminis TaxID=1343891 RepID=A0A285X5W5_9FLAO|nr:magnesium/cobalt transporter CorA [Salinimicrobium sediminis]MDX1603446.1 magnesium/cobalt transporter CorA [Salinimicrobium sediminis]MDX1752682.1 magnesium/cobalt transporter CorA [Salinimicrobium sediminis]SOC80184.1 magnesium transporter [Salinimicrobium sediminis]